MEACNKADYTIRLQTTTGTFLTPGKYVRLKHHQEYIKNHQHKHHQNYIKKLIKKYIFKKWFRAVPLPFSSFEWPPVFLAGFCGSTGINLDSHIINNVPQNIHKVRQ